MTKYFKFLLGSTCWTLLNVLPALATITGVISVNANDYSGTKFNVSRPRTCTFYANGSWTSSSNEGFHSPAGNPKYPKAPSNFKLPNYPQGALIVRRFNGTYQYIGLEKTIRFTKDELVRFMINDAKDGQAHSDNDGTIQLEYDCE